MFQGAQHVLNPVQRISQQISRKAIDTHKGSNKVHDLLEQVGHPVRGAKQSYPHELSGGQKAASDDRDGTGVRSGSC